MSSSKKFTWKVTFWQMFICLKSRTPSSPPPLHTVYEYLYSILIHTGKVGGGEELNQREGERGGSSQSWVENANMTDCISSL
jgi:hypothetical protein